MNLRFRSKMLFGSTAFLIMITTIFFAGLRSIRVEASPSDPVLQPSLMENIGRSLVAVRRNSTEVYVGWRLLGTDSASTTFNLYRSTGGGDPVKLNTDPIVQTTDFVDASPDLA